MHRRGEEDEDGSPTFAMSVHGNCILFTGTVSPGSVMALKSCLFRMLSEEFPWINLFIQSPGGDSYSAYSVYDHIKSLPCPVNTIVDGMTESAGTIIFMAGETRFVMPNSVFRPHQGRFTIIDSRYDAAMDEALNWKRDEEKARRIYVDETKRTWEKRGQTSSYRRNIHGQEVSCEGHEDCIISIVKTEIELTAREIVRYGWADEVWDRDKAKELIILKSPKDQYIKKLQRKIRHLQGRSNDSYPQNEEGSDDE